MKALKVLLVILIAFTSATLGVLFLLQENKERSYIDIYGEDESIY